MQFRINFANKLTVAANRPLYLKISERSRGIPVAETHR